MYRRTDVIAALKNQVRFAQNQNPDYENLAVTLTEPIGAKLIHHPLITVEIIDNIAQNYDHYEYPAWDGLTSYDTGQRVLVGTDVYESLIDGNVSLDPTVNPNAWELINPLSVFLEETREVAVEEVVRDVVTMKKVRGDTKTLLNTLPILTESARKGEYEIKEGRQVGFEINLQRHTNIQMIIEQVGFQSTAAEDFPMYLYHSSQLDPITQFQITTDGDFSFKWTKLTQDNSIYFEDDNLAPTGKYFLMYYEDDLIGQAYRKKVDWNKRPCMTCSGNRNFVNWRKWTNFFTIHSVSVSSSNIDYAGKTLFDFDLIRYHYDTNFGLNLRVSTKCDITDLLVSQADLFADAIDKKLQIMLLEHMSYSIRNNDIREKTMKMAMFDLQDAKVGGAGLRENYKKSLKALDFDLSNLSSLCLPENKYGIKISSVHV